jgi:hypothetical protein
VTVSVASLRATLRRHADPANAAGAQRFFTGGNMVQKGVGWLLKEATRHRADDVVAYLVANRAKTSRRVLRYATEKVAPEQRTRVLAQEPPERRSRRTR